jgi:O-antigen/teichoic acid export membrane protein
MMNKDKFNLRKNVRVSVASFMANVALVFFSYRLVIEYDGLEAVGLWSLLMAWGALIRIGDVGMGGAILRFISAKNLENEVLEIRKYIDTGLIMNVLAFAFLTLVGYFLVKKNLSFLIEDKSLVQAYLLLPILFGGIFLSSVTTLLVSSLQGLHFGYVGSYLTVGGNIIQILMVFLLVPDMGVMGLAWAQLIQFAILILVGWYLVTNKTKMLGYFPHNFSIPVLKEMLGFSLKSQVANIANGLFEPVSKILFSQFAGLQSQGVYELAYKTVSLTRNSIVAGLYASLPKLTNLIKHTPDEAQDFYNKIQKKVVTAISWVMLIVVAFSPIVSWLWIGNFNPNYWLFVSFIAVGFLINTIGAAAYNLGLATGIMKFNIIVSIMSLIFLYIFSYIFSEVWQVHGFVGGVALALGIGGMAIKRLNERLLPSLEVLSLIRKESNVKRK